MKSVVILGAGAVGCNAAVMLAKYGFDVTVVDCAQDILLGGPRVSFINHSDGFEYYKPRHQRTGKFCIDGALAKAMIWPLSRITSEICHPANPIRFFVAKGAIESNRITTEGFRSNIKSMAEHYSHMYHAMRNSAGMNDAEAAKMFLTTPNDFTRELNPEEFRDVSSVEIGVTGSGRGIDTPGYYGLLKSAMRNAKVICRLGAKVLTIVRSDRSRYMVATTAGKMEANHVLICAAYHTPKLASLVSPRIVEPRLPGAFFLNAMTFIKLPPTQNAPLLTSLTKINFTLMEKYGCMYACINPPTATTAGFAAIYFPDPSGSQRDSFVSKRGTLGTHPTSWDRIVSKGVGNTDRNVVNTFNQAKKLYPFLRDYAEISHTVCRTVFNPGIRGSHHGLDRRVREIVASNHSLTRDELVTAWIAPKWTNAELTALLAVDHVLSINGSKRLPTKQIAGCGPTNLDVAKIAEFLDLRQTESDPLDRKRYAEMTQLPEPRAGS